MSYGLPSTLFPALSSGPVGAPTPVTVSTTETPLFQATGFIVDNFATVLANAANADVAHTVTVKWYESIRPNPDPWTAAGPNPDWMPVLAQTAVLGPSSGPTQLYNTCNTAGAWLLTGTSSAGTSIVNIAARATYLTTN